MRRGHHGSGGWRNENQRHFRGRGGGAPHFRPPRGYRMMEAPRFSQSGPRPLLATPHYAGPNEEHIPPNHDRNNFHHGQHNQKHDRGHRGKNMLPYIRRMIQGEDNRPYDQPMQSFYDAMNNPNMYNNMGDVDHRQLSDVDDRHLSRPSPWVHPPPQYYDNAQKHRPYDNAEPKMLVSDYSGHRPPSSDHYGGNAGLAEDADAFSRSINDTVDIVRKRLMDREANPPPLRSSPPHTDEQTLPPRVHSEPPAKKKTNRQRQIVKSNCDKIKEKIVNQLFKMDKDKIHKLMDNPSSSTKFEYAISSLVTESQNSYNRHLRSAAEKSLNSGSEFVHHGNNTIYEDTFMKQMQCILEPQDTVLLEDIKPMVLAELSKVLQLNDHDQMGEDQPYFMKEEQQNQLTNYEHNEQLAYAYDRHSYNTPQDNCYNQYEMSDTQCVKEQPAPLFERRPRNRDFDEYGSRRRSTSTEERRTERHSIDTERKSNDSKKTGDRFKRSDTPLSLYNSSVDEVAYENDLFPGSNVEERRRERRSIEAEKRIKDAKITGDGFQRSATPLPTFDSTDDAHTYENNLFAGTSVEENIRERKSIEAEKRVNDAKITNDRFKRSANPLPLFSSTADTLIYEDDPFAELDKQYHVAVDHNFIERDDFGSQFSAKSKERCKTPVSKPFARPRSEHRSSHHDSRRCDSKKLDKSKISDNINQSIALNENKSTNIKKDIDDQLQNLAKSPLKFTTPIKDSNKTDSKTNEEVKQELLLSDSDTSLCSFKGTKPVEKSESKPKENVEMPKQERSDSETTFNEIDKSDTITKSSLSENSSRKRANDQMPLSHRKEKRKKSESSQSEINKEILNKNNNIHVTDCAAKSFDKCESSKSTNLFFSKDNGNEEMAAESKKTTDNSDKVYSDKYVKRKETPKKKDHESETKKKHESNSHTHQETSPSESKVDATTKLKPIDMFGEIPRKPSGVHQAHRNTSAPTTTPSKPIVEVKKSLPLGRKLIRKHIGTQVYRKVLHKEIQTETSKIVSTRFVQTDRKKLITRAAQTDPVAFKSDSKKSSDSFERMKEIDMEIQVLLQEKFKLYSSIESKESCSSTMESLGMAVLNMPVGHKEIGEVEMMDTIKEESVDLDKKKSAADESTLAEENNEDSIVDDFTNIPVEELEQIALESVAPNRAKREKRNVHNRVLSEERNKSESPTGKSRSRRRVKTPNFSLIEQIITDDRPLEDIISLDDLEGPINKSKKKSQKSQSKSKKPKSKKLKPKTLSLSDIKHFGIKECSVVLLREDISKYLKRKTEIPVEQEKTIVPEASEKQADDQFSVNRKNEDTQPPVVPAEKVTTVTQPQESVDNDLQFDMLDVSEDIVIGDMCEIKSNDKDVTNESVNEDIILDNSQSSIEETGVGTKATGECCLYDFSSDENLQRDSVTVTGNGDAVLALECVDKDFIAACLDGNVYHFSGDGQLLNTLRGSNLAVTCLTIVKEKYGTTVYTGSLDSRIRYYDLETGLEKGPECNVLSPIQTMDLAWDTVFVGTRTGFVLQFECKNNMLIPVSTVKFSEQSILALRALKEGPRKVLLVGARSEPVTIKDAQSGLLLRTLEGPKMTVYSLLFEDCKVYCGTSGHQIHVFDYSSGTHVGSHEGGKGAVCLRAKGGLVFAGCYDGCVYVYREGEARPLAQLRGPSLMLLSLAIVGTKIIAGYKDRSLYIWKIPLGVLQEMIL